MSKTVLWLKKMKLHGTRSTEKANFDWNNDKIQLKMHNWVRELVELRYRYVPVIQAYA